MEELKRIRDERGWSQQKLADISGVNKATINQIERGRRSPNVETLEKLADALEVEIADFFPKAQSPLPWEDEDNRRRGYQSVARERIELLDDAAGLWEKQVARGQYDLETIRDLHSMAFQLALNHMLDERQIKEYCTQEQREHLERAEEKFTAVGQVIWDAFEAELENQKTRLSREKVIEIEQYRAKRRNGLPWTGRASTG